MAAPGEVARYFIDETDYFVGAALALALAPVVHPGHPDLPQVPRQTDDLDWMPVVARLGLVVITRDKLSSKAEWEAFKEQELRVIRITAKTDQSVWATVRLIASAWDRIEELVRKAGPGPWLAVLDGAGALTLKIAGPSG
jgi:PIN like domain